VGSSGPSPAFTQLIAFTAFGGIVEAWLVSMSGRWGKTTTAATTLRFGCPPGPGRFRGAQKADRNDTRLPWYLFDPMLTSYGGNASLGKYFLVCGRSGRAPLLRSNTPACLHACLLFGLFSSLPVYLPVCFSVCTSAFLLGDGHEHLRRYLLATEISKQCSSHKR